MNVLISGISSGLGHALAELFLSQGNTVYGFSRRQPRDIKDKNFHFISVDLGNLESIPSHLKQLLSGIQKLDLVILNAGMLGEIRDIKETPVSDLKKAMDVNVWSNKIILDFLLDSVQEIDMVLAISSGAAVSGQRGWSGYGVSKAALNMLVMLYAAEQDKTHFISLAPGLVQTNMQDIIAAHVNPEKYPVVQRLQKARGTADMPLPEEAARKILSVLPELKKIQSGQFVDIRKLGENYGS